jgi:hydroxymethylpyrimidine pyrophosphatase-like HAD family hydrolase
MIRLVAIDIDGTLLDSHARIPAAHARALTEAGDRGANIALVTGRSVHFALPVAAKLPVPATLIASNGAIVKDHTGQTRMQRFLDKDAARLVLDSMPGYEESMAIVVDPPAGGSPEAILYDRMDWTHPNRSRYFERNKAFIRHVSPLASALVEDPVQVMFNGGVVAMREVAARLRALPCADQFSLQVTEYEPRDFTMLDVNRGGCSKGATLADWCVEQGIARDEVMALGDNWNDVEMLEFAGIPVVMGNACRELKDRARAAGWHLTSSHDEDGLAEALYRWALP